MKLAHRGALRSEIAVELDEGEVFVVDANRKGLAAETRISAE